jgi:hypothetical protein
MSRKGKPNLKGKQDYPRKCEHCDYVSNNPSMYHYHKKTHNSIPDGTLCWQGCGQPATVLNTHGKYTCLPKTQHCPEYIKQHSARVAKQWVGADQRKQETKQRFLEHCCGVPEVLQKMSDTKRKKFGTLDPDKAAEFRRYARFIRQRAQRWAKDQGYVLGKHTYHVDHKLSILDAWKAGLSEEIVNHPANLQIIEAKKNCGKGANSTLTVDELLLLAQAAN